MKLKIHEIRKERGLTVEALAEKSGLSKSYLSEIANGKKQINGRRLEAIAAALDCSTYDLIDDKTVPLEIMDHLKAMADLSPDDRQAVIRHALALLAEKK